MPLDSILMQEFIAARDSLLLRLRQESTQQPAYGGPMIELWPETDAHGGLYLMANGELVDETLMGGYPGLSTPEAFISRYLIDFQNNLWKGIFAIYGESLTVYCRRLDEATYPLPEFPPIPKSPAEQESQSYKDKMAEYQGATKKREKDPRYIAFVQQNPPKQLQDFILQNCPQNLLDEALSEGVKLMRAALGRETYRLQMFLLVTPDQIKRTEL